MATFPNVLVDRFDPELRSIEKRPSIANKSRRRRLREIEISRKTIKSQTNSASIRVIEGKAPPIDHKFQSRVGNFTALAVLLAAIRRGHKKLTREQD